jgi:tetratricopeptide (TPR) repeat protein
MDKSPHPLKTPGVKKTTSKKKVVQPGSRPASRKSRAWWKPLLIAVCIVAVLGLAGVAGTLAGYGSGMNARKSAATEISMASAKEQYDLAVQDLSEGRYEVARQRLEYVLALDPNYSGATDRLAEALAVLYATATPSPIPPTETATPTRDPRPVQELFSHAQSLVAGGEWDQAIDTLLALRQADPAHQTARVDGMLYISLRQRGVSKIWDQGNLGGGAYDLALAERFAPLDVQATSWRELARLYLTGSSFWGVIPERAVYYFSQVAAAAPGLRDSSGITAAERYRQALVQYGDDLAGKNDWCAAQKQYEQALSMGADAVIQEKRDNAALKCSPPTPTEAQVTETPTPTLEQGIIPSATFPVIPTPTNTEPVIEPSSTPEPPTEAPPPTDTPPPPPSETPAATEPLTTPSSE